MHRVREQELEKRCNGARDLAGEALRHECGRADALHVRLELLAGADREQLAQAGHSLEEREIQRRRRQRGIVGGRLVVRLRARVRQPPETLHEAAQVAHVLQRQRFQLAPHLRDETRLLVNTVLYSYVPIRDIWIRIHEHIH